MASNPNSKARAVLCLRRRLPFRLLGILLVLLCLCFAGMILMDAWQQTLLREAFLPDLEAMRLRDPYNGRLLSLIGARLLEASENKAAARTLQEALAAGDTAPDVWIAAAGAQAAAGEPQTALGILETGARYGVPGTKDAEKRVLNLAGTPTPIDVAMAISRDGSYNLAAGRAHGSFLNGLVNWWGHLRPEQSGFSTRSLWAQEEPDSALAQRLWGEALTRNRVYPQAVKVLERARSLNPDSPEVHLALANLFVDEEQEQKAEPEVTRCLILRPAWEPALLLQSRLARARNSPRFEDVALGDGLRYRWSVSGKRPLNILQLIGRGAAFLDYNNDGNLDILLVGPRLALYRGDGRGHFTDVSQETGLDALSGDFRGCATGDYDNDGYEDLYISAYHGGVLLHNEHGQRFRDVTRQAGIQPQPWGSSCAFADIDNDGKLDMYIGDYVSFGPDTHPQLCDFDGHLSACGPAYYPGLRGALYHNEGGGRFKDVTAQWGAGKVAGKALGVAFAEDDSGKQSLAIANDGEPGDLLRNLGSHLENIGVASGTAYDNHGSVHAGMGIDWGDYDNDGKLDLAVAASIHEQDCVYHRNGPESFTEQSGPLGIGNRTMRSVSFGLKWLDYDNDGWLDLVISNGHIQDNVSEITPGETYRETCQLFHNEHGGSFTEATSRAGPGFEKAIVGRGLAVGDFDNDGRVDVLVVDMEGAPLLLHNETPFTGHWLGVHLRGTRSNRDGIGAQVTVESGGLKQTRRCGTDGSFFSASDPRVHFGLGSAASIRTLSVRWPSGAVTILHNLTADRMISITE